MATKPTSKPRWATTPTNNGPGGEPNIDTPISAKLDIGWEYLEKPPREWFNWLQNLNYQWINYFEEVTDAPILSTDFLQDVANTTGLTFATLAGKVRRDDDLSFIAATLLPLSPSTTSTVYIDLSTNSVQAAVSPPTSDIIRLYSVTTDATSITSIDNRITWANATFPHKIQGGTTSVKVLPVFNNRIDFTILGSDKANIGASGFTLLDSSSLSKVRINGLTGHSLELYNNNSEHILNAQGTGTPEIQLRVNNSQKIKITSTALDVQVRSFFINGDMVDPSIALINSPGTGFYRHADNVLGVTTNSNLRALFHDGGFAINVDGSAAEPSLRWNLDPLSDSGFYHPVGVDGVIGVTCNGTQVGQWSTTGVGFATLSITGRGILSTHDDALGVAGFFQANHVSFTNSVLTSQSIRASSAAFDLIRGNTNAGGTPGKVFRVDGTGHIFNSSGISTTGADIAEAFEWQDGNPNSEDRIGKSIIIENGKIRFWQVGDPDPDGIITDQRLATAVGNTASLEWQGKYLKDDFGRIQEETVDWWSWDALNPDVIDEMNPPGYYADSVPDGVVVPEDKVITSATRPIFNPSYDPNLVYEPRLERKEWDAVSLHGIVKIYNTETVATHWKKLRDVSVNVEEYYIFPK